MSLVKVKNSKQCKATMEVNQNNIIVDEVRCCRDEGHPGGHTDPTGKYQWYSRDNLCKLMEEKYRPVEEAGEIIERINHERKKLS